MLNNKLRDMERLYPDWDIDNYTAIAIYRSHAEQDRRVYFVQRNVAKVGR